MNLLKSIVIIGAGPAGLFCSFELLKRGYRVDLYDQQSSPGKKFLVAGNGGLNLTHSEDLKSFCQKYGENEELFKDLISKFTPNDLRSWCAELGVETFIGTSGRVFPKSFKAADILRRWQNALKDNQNFELHLKHRLTEIDLEQKELCFQSDEREIKVKADVIVLALGGASWRRTGSDGKWTQLFEHTSIDPLPFKPMNCGFECKWSDFFKKKVDRKEIKNIALTHKNKTVRGEVMITPFGVEGGALYALSSEIRNSIESEQSAMVYLDLKPDLSVHELHTRLTKGMRSGKSLSGVLKSALKLGPVAYTLLRERLDDEELTNPSRIASVLKSLALVFTAPRPIDEAISTAGGVSFEDLSEELELKSYQDIFLIGEMLDFEAPTGGYLLQGCFATAYQVAQTISTRSSS